MSIMDEMIKGAMNEVKQRIESPYDDSRASAEIEKLVILRRAYAENQSFSPGDIVEWIPGLRNRLTKYGEPVIVVETGLPTINPDQDSGSPYFGEKLDLRIGRIDSSGDFLIFSADSSRFKMYEPKPEVKKDAAAE